MQVRGCLAAFGMAHDTASSHASVCDAETARAHCSVRPAHGKLHLAKLTLHCRHHGPSLIDFTNTNCPRHAAHMLWGTPRDAHTPLRGVADILCAPSRFRESPPAGDALPLIQRPFPDQDPKAAARLHPPGVGTSQRPPESGALTQPTPMGITRRDSRP
jgi:hypothetical protein